MIQVMRDRPDMLKAALGRKLHIEALKKIRGTHWESVLFPEPVSLDDRRMLKEFRRRDEEINGSLGGGSGPEGA